MSRRKVYFGMIGVALFLATGSFLAFQWLNDAPEKQQYNNPLAGKVIYRDADRPVVSTVETLRNQNRIIEANTLDRIAGQPGTTWLTGPSASDPTAEKDIAMVRRTSTEAAREKTVPVYQLYAIPGRDACAGYSAQGFTDRSDYLRWVSRISQALQSEAIISLEADSIAQTIHESCFSDSQKQERYATLAEAVALLSRAPQKTYIYLDAGHAEWFPNPEVLVGPLRQSGIARARGVAVNVSFFETTDANVRWGQRLIALVGTDKGVIIDTGRNGNGPPGATVSGEARWCNPPGRKIGDKPSTSTGHESIDAYIWIKNIGESDGSCFGNPPAGTFSPDLAEALVTN